MGPAVPRVYSPAEQAHFVALTDHQQEDSIYANDIFAYYSDAERRYDATRNSQYMTNQPEINEKMRCILVDWLVDVHLKFRLRPGTFYLTVDIVDRFLSNAQVTRATLQLIGVTATLLAAKHEEIWPPEMRDCVYIAANTYTSDEIIAKEREITAALKFHLSSPTCYVFANRGLTLTQASDKLRSLTMMYLEYAALHYAMVKFLPSVVGSAAVLLARFTIRSQSPIAASTTEGVAAPMEAVEVDRSCSQCLWPNDLGAQLGLEYAGVLPCAQELLGFAQLHHVATGARYQAIRRKYSHSKFHNVAPLDISGCLPLNANE